MFCGVACWRSREAEKRLHLHRSLLLRYVFCVGRTKKTKDKQFPSLFLLFYCAFFCLLAVIMLPVYLVWLYLLLFSLSFAPNSTIYDIL